MLISVGMYLPFPTTMAIFCGGVIKWIGDVIARRKSIKEERVMEAIGNRGLLVSSGFVAGEALTGLILAALVAANVKLTDGNLVSALVGHWLGAAVMIFLAIFMVTQSLRAANGPLPSPAAGGGAAEEAAYRGNVDAARDRVAAVEKELEQAKQSLADLEKKQ